VWTWSETTALASWLFLILFVAGVSLIAVVIVRLLASRKRGVGRRPDGSRPASLRRPDRHMRDESSATGYDEHLGRFRNSKNGGALWRLRR
jgi:hypothetical protein